MGASRDQRRVARQSRDRAAARGHGGWRGRAAIARPARGHRPLRPRDTTASTAAGREAQRGVPRGRPPGPARPGSSGQITPAASPLLPSSSTKLPPPSLPSGRADPVAAPGRRPVLAAARRQSDGSVRPAGLPARRCCPRPVRRPAAGCRCRARIRGAADRFLRLGPAHRRSASIRCTPVTDSRSSSATLASVGTGSSFCSPSLGPTSRTEIRSGSSQLTPPG